MDAADRPELAHRSVLKTHLEDLSIWDHGRVGPSDVEVTLHELPEAAPVHLRVVSPVHLRHVVPLDLADAVQGDIASKGHREIVAQRKNLSTLYQEHPTSGTCLHGRTMGKQRHEAIA